MRRVAPAVVLAIVVSGLVSVAHAADLPDLSDLPILRGSMTDGLSTARTNWDGFYVGAQGGYGSSDENFGGSNQTMTASMLANTAIESAYGVSQWPLTLGKTTAQTTAYGAFAGYNSQWDDVVLGVEASYMHGTFGGSSSASMRRFFSDAPLGAYYHDVTSTATSSVSITDMATIRGRAGYAMGAFLPYAFFGLALGNADITQTASVIDRYATYVPPYPSTCSSAGTPYCFTPSASSSQHNRLAYGYSAGLGVDVNLIGGLFARAEYEYVRFTSMKVDTSINTARVGLGYKF